MLFHDQLRKVATRLVRLLVSSYDKLKIELAYEEEREEPNYSIKLSKSSPEFSWNSQGLQLSISSVGGKVLKSRCGRIVAIFGLVSLCDESGEID